MEFRWINGFEIKVEIQNGNEVCIAANQEGLLSLASHLITLAQKQPGDHFHLDQYNCLEEGSAELIVCRTGS
ncbi:MAG: hypothetical protein IJM79_06515 [Erysipelotrichaceae bacterium]|nr:hypothetical protein [Erysipelotrichaceae bacterium]